MREKIKLNNKAPGADSVINEFLKYGGSKVGNKLLTITNMIFDDQIFTLKLIIEKYLSYQTPLVFN